MKKVAMVCVLATAVGAGACMPGDWTVRDDYNPPDRISGRFAQVGKPMPVKERRAVPPRRAGEDRPAQGRQSRVPSMAGGALVGGALGYVLGAAACDDLRDTDEECSDRAVEGALLGGSVGALIGAVVGN